MDERRYGLEEFELYQLARAFRNGVYRVISRLPAEERYCLEKQMRRAAISVSNNVAEGHGRWHYLENIQHCRIARGSVEELIDDLNVCLDQHFVDPVMVTALKDDAFNLVRKINGYIAYLRKSKQGGES